MEKATPQEEGSKFGADPEKVKVQKLSKDIFHTGMHAMHFYTPGLILLLW